MIREVADPQSAWLVVPEAWKSSREPHATIGAADQKHRAGAFKRPMDVVEETGIPGR